MPRKILQNINTDFFHVIVQGINKEYIFNQEVFMNKYLKLIYQYSNEFNINLISYCIMGNHTHMLIECKKNKNLSSFMKIVNQKFAQYYNYKKDRVGTVFRDRFLYEPIYNQTYLLNCFVYIHNNPKKANIVTNCSEYKYSSYNDYINKTGVASFNNINLLFNTQNYLYIFKELHSRGTYALDIDITSSEILNLKIKEFESQNSTNLKSILQNKNQITNLIIYLKTSYSPLRLSDIDISKELNLSVNQIRYLFKKRK